MGHRYKSSPYSVGLKEYGLRKEKEGFRRQKQREIQKRRKMYTKLRDQIQALFDKYQFDAGPVKKVIKKNMIQDCAELTNLLQKCNLK